jgi:acyl transferase domain-containing protein/acyl carrier protein
MDPILDAFAAKVRSVPRQTPQLRYVSNVTGTWITDEQATSPEYWARHLRATVQFSAGIATLLDDGIDFLVDAGPGRTAGTLAGLHRQGIAVAHSLPGPTEKQPDQAVLLGGLARAWVHGVPVDWQAFRGAERRRRVPLPTYPFERKRYWIEPNEEEVERRRARVRANEKAATPEEWLYVRNWQQRPPAGNTPAAGETSVTWLVLSDGSPESRRIASSLSSLTGPTNTAETPQPRTWVDPARLIVATVGAPFGGQLYGACTFDPSRAADYDALVAAALRVGGPLRIVHLTSAAAAPGSRDTEMERGFYSVALLGSALARLHPGSTVVKVVTSNAEAVTGTESLVPERASVGGVCLALTQEHPEIRCHRIDVAALTAADERALIDELTTDEGETLIAIRGGRRWAPVMEPLTGDPKHPFALWPEEHYVIVGGLGTIGFSAAWYLARAARAKLTIISRTPMPPRAEWPSYLATHPAGDPVSGRISRIGSLEQAGSVVQTFSADAADAAAMRSAIERAELSFGPIRGVITAAGLMDESAFAPLERFDAAAAAAHFRPKLQGLPALEEALGQRPIDFCVVMSSLSVVLGGVGYAAYAGANAYLDAFVHRQNIERSGRWSVINWDAWHPIDGALPATSLLARLALKPIEGVGALERLLRFRGVTQAFVSSADLPARIRFSIPDAPEAIASTPSDATTETAIPAFAPEPDVTPTEAIIIAIWRQTLGASHVDLHDTFLDLGGSSLTAIQVIGRIETELGVRITIEEFIFQTAAQLASLCDARRAVAAPVEEPAAFAAEPAASAPAQPRGWARLRNALKSRSDADAVRS